MLAPKATPSAMPIGAVALAALAAAAGVFAWYRIREDTPALAAAAPVSQGAPAPSRVRPNPTSVGLAVDSKGVYVADWGAWMEFAPPAFEAAISDGALGAENVLLHVLQRALPREQWPPPEGTSQREQYQDMVKVVAEWLTLEPEPGPHLRVVES